MDLKEKSISPAPFPHNPILTCIFNVFWCAIEVFYQLTPATLNGGGEKKDHFESNDNWREVIFKAVRVWMGFIKSVRERRGQFLR